FPHHEMSALHARAALRGPGDTDGPAFARVYVHAGMVRLGGEKMSKSLGNLVFVSRLLRDGADPMAVRLAILAHHYRHDWDWTADALTAAATRLARWREAVAGGGGPGAPPAGPGGEGGGGRGRAERPAGARRAGRGPRAHGRRPRRPGRPGRGG